MGLLDCSCDPISLPPRVHGSNIGIAFQEPITGCCLPPPCCACAKGRSYNWIMENRVEVNWAFFNPLFCSTSDCISVAYFDQPPFKTFCICCQPAFHTQKETCYLCCCINCEGLYNTCVRPCCGECVSVSPCSNLFCGSSVCSRGLLCGFPCSRPMMMGLSDATAVKKALLEQRDVTYQRKAKH